MKNTDNTSIIKELVNNLDAKNQQLIITLAEALEKQQVLIANKLGMKPEELQHKLSDNSKKNNAFRKKEQKKITICILLVLVILFASLFGAFAFSSDFHHATVEVFEDEGDDYSRVSSASADRGTADAVTFTFINYTAINCKGGRKGMEASFLAKP